MQLRIVSSTITVSNANSNNLLEKLCIRRDHRARRGLGLDESKFTKSVIVFICFTLLVHTASVNNVAVTTVLYLYWNVY